MGPITFFYDPACILPPQENPLFLAKRQGKAKGEAAKDGDKKKKAAKA